MNPLATARTVLENAGYDTWMPPDETQRFYFEDLSLFGMATCYPSLPNLLAGWEDRQDEFLEAHGEALRSAENEEKVWNAYSVHLTVADFEDDEEQRVRQQNELFQIAQDFRGTRKVVGAEVTEKQDVHAALLPLLPLQSQPALAAENYRTQLEEELAENFDQRLLGVLRPEAATADIVNNLLADP
jgi:hypothetical protein